MADLLQSGMAWLRDQLKANASEPVVYSRGAQQATLQATLGTTLLKVDDGAGGNRVVWTDRDFLLPAADLALGGLAVTPQKGDRVAVTLDGVAEVYEVLAPPGEPDWRWSDPFRKMYRVHCKRVG